MTARRFIPLPEGQFGTAASTALLLSMFPCAALEGRVPGGWRIEGMGRAVTTCRGVWVHGNAAIAKADELKPAESRHLLDGFNVEFQGARRARAGEDY